MQQLYRHRLPVRAVESLEKRGKGHAEGVRPLVLSSISLPGKRTVEARLVLPRRTSPDPLATVRQTHLPPQLPQLLSCHVPNIVQT